MIKKLLASVREYKADAIKTPVFVSLEVVMECVIPLLMASLIDKGINAGDMGQVLLYGAILVAAALLSLLFGVLSGKSSAKSSAGFAKNLRKDMFDHVQTFSFSNIDKYSTGGLVTRMTTDVTHVQNAFQMLTRIAVRCPFMLIFSLVAAIRINARMSLVFLCVLPVLGFGLFMIGSKAHPRFRKMFKFYDRLNTVVQENLYGIRVVKAFVREEHEGKKLDDAAENIYQTSVSAEKILAFNQPLMQFSIYTCMLLLSWFGAKMIVGSGAGVGATLTTGQLTSLFTYTMQILISLMMLSMVFIMIIMSRAAAERITEVLNEESDIVAPADAVKEVRDGSITFEHVEFRYNRTAEKPVLDDICLSIPSGATVGILGSTGSSKSSFVQLIPRLYDTTAGTVSVGGVDVRRYDLDVLRDKVAFVLQKNVLFSGTIKDNLRWGNPDATDAEMEHVCKLAQADSFIRQFPDGYDTKIEQGGTNVSGGQKQRLCIARALLKKPKVLILDDSTSAVDTATDAMIRKAFHENIPDVTKLIIAQRVTSVMDSDMIVVMDSGRVSAVGTHEELLKTSDIYREVYESQMKGSEAV